MSTLIRLGRGAQGRSAVVGAFPHNWNNRFVLGRGAGEPEHWEATPPATLEDGIFCATGTHSPGDVLLTYIGPPLAGGEDVTLSFTYDSGIRAGGIEAYAMPSGTLVDSGNFQAGTLTLDWTQPPTDTGIEIRASSFETQGCYLFGSSVTKEPANWIAPVDPPAGEVGVPYLYDLEPLLSGTPPITVAVLSGDLPDGLSIVGLTIQGTPTTPTS